MTSRTSNPRSGGDDDIDAALPAGLRALPIERLVELLTQSGHEEPDHGRGSAARSSPSFRLDSPSSRRTRCTCSASESVAPLTRVGFADTRSCNGQRERLGK